MSQDTNTCYVILKKIVSKREWRHCIRTMFSLVLFTICKFEVNIVFVDFGVIIFLYNVVVVPVHKQNVCIKNRTILSTQTMG